MRRLWLSVGPGLCRSLAAGPLPCGSVDMAIYHLSVGIISRKAGRSSTAAAAYRSGERVIDERTGDEHDYTRKQGVEDTQIVMPSGCEWQPSRAELWNAVEHKNKRADAQVAREFEVALPAELPPSARKELAVEFAQKISDRYGIAADVAIHAPSRNGDERNHHAHILTTTNRVEQDGRLGNKVRELDAVAHDRSANNRDKPNEVEQLRAEWSSLTNRYLERHGLEQRIDHRSLSDQRSAAREIDDQAKARDLDREPTRHMGPAATAIERGKPLYRNGREVDGEWKTPPRRSELGDVNRRIELASQMGKIQREKEQVGRSIIDLESSISDATKERDDFRSFLAGQRDNAGSRGTEKQPQRTDWSSMREQAGSRGSGQTERDEQAERIAAAIKHYAAYAEPRPSPIERERDTPQIILDPNAPIAPTRPSLRERFGHLVAPKDSPTRQDQSRTPALQKEQQMEQLAGMPPAQPGREEGAALRRAEQQQQQPKQEQPQPKQEQDQARRQEQQNQLQQIAARMEQNRLERERRRQEQERNGHDMTR